ncbi:type IV secretion system protein [Gluconobacter cerinus]|uniref:type IV secretion system protein n=1 Tax=Gluconobacter cerinus TaxID=38307 RepID=UPI001B8D3ACC|nr:type IV secretion system protein [Gluconobacter cerinus]MBS0984271.1 type IV secretion system protein [Gluconobacter cerinus]
MANVSAVSLAPLGSFLINFDTAITTAQLSAVSGLVAAMGQPLAACAVIYLALEGWKIAAGDLDRINSLTFTFAKILAIMYVATNLDVFNQWVVQVWEHGFPDEIVKAINQSTGESSSVSGVAGGIDKLWAHMWLRAAHIWKTAGWTDVASRLIAGVTVIIGSIGLVLIAGVYLIARFLFAIVVVLGPVCIGCAMFQTTRPVFERWIGKGISMIVLQVAAVITMQIVLTGSETWAHDNSILDAGGLPMMIQNEISMVVWILLGAFAIYSLPTLAYSIGTGIAVSFAPIVAAALAASGIMSGLGGGNSGGSDGAPSGGGGSSSDASFEPSEINLSQARLESASSGAMLGSYGTAGYLSSDAGGFLPPPPPALPPPPSV